MAKIAKLIREWMLPGTIVLGIGLYLIYYFCPSLRPIGPVCHAIASHGQRWVIALLLFFQFVRVSPHDLLLCRWHLVALAVQLTGFLVFAALLALNIIPPAARVPAECAMLCMICPTASAAGVVTDRLGGHLPSTVSYLVLINVAATLLIPLIIPVVSPSASLSFLQYAGHLALRVFPVLIVPGLAAWLIRYTTHDLQRRLMKWSPNSFYIWGFGLTFAMILSTRALILSGFGAGIIASIVAVSVLCCFIQFFIGHRIGRGHSGRITAGQALGQKNTGFLIWLGYSYLTPVTSVAGGLYAIWQNLFNSWELYRMENQNSDTHA